MLERKQGLRKFWTIVSLLVIIHIAMFDLVIITSEDSLQVQYTPDDAYYYLSLAKNFANLGIWTFDSGHSLTSGFHLLWAYLLSTVYIITNPSLSAFVQYGVILSSLLTIISLLISWKVGLSFEKPFYMLLLALIASSRNFVYNSVSVMEWPLAILFSLLYCIQYKRSFNSSNLRHNAIVLFILGLVGSLSRSDFGLLPLFLFVSSLLIFLLGRKNRIIPSFWGLVGALGGIFLTLGHNYLFTGDYLQSSARMKTYWTQIYGYNMDVVRLLRTILGLDRVDLKLFMVIFGIVSLFLLAIIIAKQRKRNIFSFEDIAYQWSLFIAATLCVVGYTLFYLLNGSVQPWYSANLVIPVFLILLSISVYVVEIFGNSSIGGMILSGFVIVIIFTNSISLYPIKTTNSIWPHQSGMLEAGKYLAEQEFDGLIGSWNAGIIGYYQGGSVVNLDGLVNNEVYEYAISNDLPSYISSKGIRYIIDYENNFLDEKRRLRGGIDDWDFISRLRPIVVFDDGEYYWKHLTLYECPC